MTKEIMAKLLNKRETILEKKRITEENDIKIQMERLNVLSGKIKEDLEIRKLIYNAGVEKYVKQFYWELRKNKLGLLEGNDYYNYTLFSIVQDMKYLKMWREERPVGYDFLNGDFIIYDNVDRGYRYVDLKTKEEELYFTQKDNRKIVMNSEFLKSFCDGLEIFHKDFQKFVEEINWENID